MRCLKFEVFNSFTQPKISTFRIWKSIGKKGVFPPGDTNKTVISIYKAHI